LSSKSKIVPVIGLYPVLQAAEKYHL